jgi:hypothetical protein
LSTHRVLRGMTLVNHNAGYYPGRMYDHRIKMELVKPASHSSEHFPFRPSTRAIAAKARVEKGYVSKVEELGRTGMLMNHRDPETTTTRGTVPTFFRSRSRGSIPSLSLNRA